jgi:hypothetical protein
MPALLNRTSSRPNASLVRANAALTEAGSLTSVGITRLFRWCSCPRRGLLELVGPASGERDREALPHEGERDRLADAGAGAGDEGDFV